ncbi:EpsG family protein [Niameybacter massiliensis]|uniref:EpsG family protein n=1 Tax=Niameybacter massiliensis TaxID=1658108 RepID=UPI0006B55138|nr:EpsG family protein [Niameybacter massiliensis]
MVHMILATALLFSFPDKQKRVPYHMISFTILYLFLALRYNYGNDYITYYNMHTAMNSGLGGWGSNDILFKGLNLLLPNFYLFIAIISLFYIVVIYLFMKYANRGNSYLFSVLIWLINPYLFLVHLSTIRQTIAICFFIIATKYIVEKKCFKYYLSILIAMGFHKSAIILLPIYFIINDSKIKRKNTMIIYGILAILIATPILDIIIYTVLEYFPAHYKVYFEQGLKNSFRATVLSSFYFFIILLNINKLEYRDMIYAKLSLIATIISILCFKLSMLTRIGMYFDVFLIVTIPAVFKTIKTKLYRQILFLIMIGIYILRYTSFFINPIWHEAYSSYTTLFGR